jgi:hypothetical protein
MRWVISLVLIGFCAGEVYSQANPDPTVSHPMVCKKDGEVGPAGKCVPFDPNNPEHRKLLDKMNQTPPDLRSAPPVQPPLPPDTVKSLGPTGFQTPPLVTAPNPSVPKPPINTATAPSCDLACSEAKLHQFDTPPSQPGQAPPGAGALWGVSQALRERQERSRAATLQQQEQELKATRDSVFAIKSDAERLKADLNALEQIRGKYILQSFDTVPSEVVKAFNAYRKDVCKIHQKWLPNEDVSDLVRDLNGFPMSCQEVQKN